MESPSNKRSRWQFSLRFLLAGTFVVFLLLGAFMWRYRRAQAQSRTIRELQSIGCSAAYDFEIQENEYGELIWIRNSKSSISEPLLKWLGPDFFHDVAAAAAPDSHSGHPKSDEEISQFWSAVVSFSKLRFLDSDAAWCRSQDFNQVARNDSLRAVTLSGHDLTNSQLEIIGSIPNLQAIDIYLIDSKIDDEGVKELSGLVHLRSLSIVCHRVLDIFDEPPITDAAVKNLCRCTKLESVTLPFKRLNNNSARELAKLPHLRRLDLSHSQLSDAGIAYFNNSMELEEIVIDDTGVSGPGLRLLSKLPHLRKLSMKGTPLGDEDLEYVNVLRQLEVLNLSRTFVTDQGLATQGLPPNLVEIRLGNTAITDFGLVQLARHRSLKKVGLWHTKATPQGAAELKTALPGCEIEFN